MNSIRSWPKFARKVRNIEGINLLKQLNQFPNSILVSGCQRSGTTVLSNVITASDGIVDFVKGRDSELDAALILAGYTSQTNRGRYCFQTTYLNESYPEYFLQQTHYRLIWVVRNPYSVICSILYNWKRFAFNELFEACGTQYLSDSELTNFKRFGYVAIPKIKRACLAYNGKVSQLFEIEKKLGERILVIDYDNMIINKQNALKQLYDFVDLDYKPHYGEILTSNSIGKSKKLSSKQRLVIEKMCTSIYTKAKSYACNV